jgi:hypothetical protein
MRIESHMNEDHGRRCSKILLDANEAIVHQVVTTKCAHKCPPRIAKSHSIKT